MKRYSLIGYLTIALSVFGLAACNGDRGVQAAPEDGARALSPAEQDFVMNAAKANVSEVNLARLALQKSQNDDVRDLANMMQSDHAKTLEDLTDIAQQRGMAIPHAASEETKQDMDRLSGLSGDEFDREYANMMVASHVKAVDLFRDQMNIAQNADIQKFASGRLPVIEMHLEKAQELQSKLFSGKARP